MKKNGRRVLSFILTTVMVFALLPIISKPLIVEADATEPAKHNHGEHAALNCSEHVGWDAIGDAAALNTLCSDGGKGYLTANIDIGHLLINIDKVVDLCLNGYSITGIDSNDVFRVYGTLNLYDENGNTGKIQHDNVHKGSGVFVAGGRFTMTGGKITDNNIYGEVSEHQFKGGGVCVKDNGSFTMTGGKIVGNTASEGGGVYVSGGSTEFTMKGGEISGNSANSGAGVYFSYGTFTMTGGKITQNTASYYGGGVIIDESVNVNVSIFNMNGGEISNNSAPYGGGVKVDAGTFTLESGKIINNTADFGGGIDYRGGTMEMNGGEISGNTGGFGGGINVYCNTFTMNGGKIFNNTATGCGGGVNVGDGTFLMTGGELTDNNSSNDGGGVNIGDDVFEMTGGIISGNTASGNGDGVYYASGSDSTYNSNNIKTEGYVYDEIYSDNGEITPHIVTFNSNDNPTSLKSQYYINSNLKLAPNTFTHTGYTFSGWNTEPNGTGRNYLDEASITNAGDLTLYANWEFNYTVRFDANGGSGSMTGMNRYNNDNIALTLNTFEKEGYTFAGWNTAANGSETNYNDGATANLTTTPNDTVTLYAQWSVNDYTVKFDANGGRGTMSDMSRTYNVVVPLTVNAFTREGYSFAGWNTAANGSGTSYDDGATINFVTTANATVNLYAQWTPNNYTVKFDANGGTGTMADQRRAYDDTTPLTANAFTLDGSTFSGWNTQADGNGTSYADKATDNLTSTDGDTVILYAQWNSISYNITVTNDGNGTASASATSGIKGTNITLTATPNEGYRFAGWEVVSGGVTLADTSSATTSFKIGTSNVEVKATFEEIPATVYSVTVSNDGNGTATASVTSGIEGTEVTVTATPNDGYKFAGWEVISGDVTLADAASETTTFTIGTEDVEIKANFEEIKEPEPEPEDPEPKKPDPEPKEPDPEPKDPDPVPEKDWLDDLRLALSIAAELGGTQTVEYSGNFALPLEIMEFLKAHPLITLVYHVTYEGTEYTARIKGSDAIADPAILYYGPLWLFANYGNGKVPTGAIGNGTYIVKAGDTLTAISVKLGVSIQYLVDRNGIKDPDKIYVNQVLYY